MNIARAYKLYNIGIPIGKQEYDVIYFYLNFVKDLNVIKLNFEPHAIFYFKNDDLLFKIHDEKLYINHTFRDVLDYIFKLKNSEISILSKHIIKNIYKTDIKNFGIIRKNEYDKILDSYKKLN